MSKRPTIIVLGLGITGSSITARLAQTGFPVTGIEQFAPLHERGSSHGDTRIYRRVPHEGEVYVDLAGRSLEGWHNWSAAAGEKLIVECGGIDAGPAGSAMVQETENLCRTHTQEYQSLTGAAFNRRHSHFNLPADWHVVYQRSSGFVRPDATRSFLHRTAKAAGARLLHDTSVVAFDPLPQGFRVRTTAEALTCDILVVAAGSWLPRLMKGLPLSFTAERRVIAWYQPFQADMLADGRLPIFCLDADGGWYGMPTPDGAIKIGHNQHLNQRINPDDPIVPVSDADKAKLEPCIKKYFNGFSSEPFAAKPCIYTLLDDHNFVIDRHPQHPDIFLFSCCSGHGFKYAPEYGTIAADLIMGKTRPDLAAFSLTRTSPSAVRFNS
jgi:sarcosine oxidase